MDATERQILRAQLVAGGIIRHWTWDKSKRELDRCIEVMAEELARIEESDVVSKIRENLLLHGLRVPERSAPVHADSPVPQNLELIGSPAGGGVCSRLPKADSNGAAVHRADTLFLQPPRDADTLSNNGTIELRELKHADDLSSHEPGVDFGLTKQVCRTFKNMESENKPSVPVHVPRAVSDEVEQKPGHETDESLNTRFTLVDSKGRERPAVKGPTGSWTWRNYAYNRVPPAIEQAVYEKFKQGWSKSKLAREFHLNRRTIIRICSAASATRNGES